MKLFKKKSAIILAAALPITALAACGGNAGDGGSQTAAVTDVSENTGSTEIQSSGAQGEKILHAGSNAMYGASNMDPADDWNGWYLEFFGIAETLFKLDDAYDAIPTLVKDYKEPEDGVTWEFELRDDVLFHNGEKMTAQSVVDCFNRTFEVNERAAETLSVAKMEADGQKLTITTPSPDPTFLYSLCDPLFSVYYADSSISDDEYDKQTFATGPFMVDEFTADVQTVVAKNKDYWNGKPKLDKVYLDTYKDEDAMIMAMQNEEVYLIDGTSAALLTCNEATGFEVQSASTSRAEKIVFNFKNSEFANEPAIREAIAWTIDRDGYETMCNETKLANWGIYPTTLTYGDNSALDIKITSQDKDQAGKVLDAAGFTDTDGDGIREANGKPIKLKMILGQGYDDVLNLCDILTSDLKSVGIELETEVYEALDGQDYFDQVEWDMNIEGKYMTPTGNASYFFDQDVVTGGSGNQGGYSNPEIDKLAEELHNTFDEDARNELVFKMEQILLDENSFIVFANGTNTYINNRKLTGYSPNPSNYYYLSETMDIEE